MTKDEAILAMRHGLKVTHEYFSDHEWATMKDGMVLTEDGVTVYPEIFWGIRASQDGWEDGWFIFHESEKAKQKRLLIEMMQEDEKNGMYEGSESQEDDYDVWTEFGNELNKLLEPHNDPFGVHPAMDILRLRKQFTITRKP